MAWTSGEAARRFGAPLPRKLPEGIFVALFAGTAVLAKAVARRGVDAWAYDLVYGPQSDLSAPLLQRRIEEDLMSELIRGLAVEIACSTWSRARDIPNGPARLRDDFEGLWGLPSLTGKSLLAVEKANRSGSGPPAF